MRNIVQLGETVRLYLPFTDIDTGALLDPATLVAVIRAPDNTTLTINYPDTNFVRESAGSYFLRVTASMVGTHRYKVTANFTAGDVDVRDGRFDVESTV